MSRLVTVWLLWALSLVVSVLAAPKSNLPHPADPFADPRADPYNPLKYIASNTLTAIAFTLILLVAFTQTFLTWKYKAKFMLSMTIGAYTFAFGIGTRFGLHVHPESKGIYIVEYLFVVLSPCAFIAAEYVLLGRLARHLRCDKYLLVTPRRITIVFISSDITTFLIQACGGALSISANDEPLALAGSRIFLAGLALQLLSFSIFSCIFITFLYRVQKHEPEIYIRDRDIVWYKDWRTLARVMVLSCIGILIRSVYRCIELGQGFQGRLATSEPFFYGLDTLPLFIAIVVYLPFWPGRFIRPIREIVEDSEEKRSRDTEVVPEEK